MKPLRAFFLALLLLAAARPLPAQSVAVFQQDYSMEMYFRFFLADCGPGELRCLWCANNDIQVGWKMTVNFRTGSVDILRDVYDGMRDRPPPTPGELKPATLAKIQDLLDALPPTQDAFPMQQCVFIAHRVGEQVQISQYNRVNPPDFVQKLYDLADGNILLGEPDLRDLISLTAADTENLAGFARPWSVPRVLGWHQQAKTPADRKFWAHVLAVSGDPRAALALEKNLGQGDNSADLRDLASYFFDKSASQNDQTLADAQQWFKIHHPRLEAQAAFLSGQTPPSSPAADPNCPEVAYRETTGSNTPYAEAAVTITRAGLAHITVKRAVPVERDFQLSPELIAALRQLLANGRFFTAPEPPAPASTYTSTTELTIAADGQKRTIRQAWATDFAPLRAYVSQLIFLTSASIVPPPAYPRASPTR